jgi:hypothetical protein
MMSFSIKPLRFALAASLLTLGLAMSADAANPQLSININSSTVSGSLALAQSGLVYNFGGGAGNYLYVGENNGVYTVLGTSSTQLAENASLGGDQWGYEFKVTVTDNAPGTQAGAQLFDVTTEVRSNPLDSGTGQSVTQITLSDSTFTAPTGSVYLSSYVSGVQGPGVPTDTFQSFFDQAGNDQSTTSQVITSGGNTVNSASPFSNAGSFTLRNVTTIQLTPNGLNNQNGRVTTNGQTYLLKELTPAIATPEPATLALALSGLGTLGLSGLRRLRRGTNPA